MRTIFLLLCCCQLYAGSGGAVSLLYQKLSEGFYCGKSTDFSRFIAPGTDHTAVWQALELVSRRQRDCRQLHTAAGKLLQQLKNSPDAVNTFALAELLNFSPSAVYDPQAAAVLYKYSAERDFPPAMIRLAAMLYDGTIVRFDRALAVRLLENAAADGAAAAWRYLSMIYYHSNDPVQAGKYLDLALAHQCPAALAQTAAERILQQQELSWQEKITRLAELCRDSSAALPYLALAYRQKPLAEWFMAANSALLAEKYPAEKARARQLLLEADRQQACVFILKAMKAELSGFADLQRMPQNTDLLRLKLLQHEYDPVHKELQKMLQRDPEALYCSGILLQLAMEDLPAEQLEKLLSAQRAETLAGRVNHSILAMLAGNKKNQLALSRQLLDFIKDQPLQKSFDWQKELAAVIPGIAGIEKTSSRIDQWEIAWNIALLLQLDALLAAKQKSQAEELLKKYPLRKLKKPDSIFQYNFIKTFTPGLLQVEL